MRTSATGLLLLAACVPPEVPAWLVTEPTFLGVQTAVVVDGPHADGLPVYPGHVRNKPLPLDTLEWRWLGLAPDGVEIRPPLWLTCPGTSECTGMTGMPDPPACPDPLPLVVDHVCRLGTGASIRTRYADIDTLPAAKNYAYTGVFVITSAEIDPETCLTRLRRSIPDDLEHCLLATGGVGFGPYYWFKALLPGGDQDTDDLPPELLNEPADTNPTLYFVVRRSSAGDQPPLAIASGTVTVRALETVHVTLMPGDDAAQHYPRLVGQTGTQPTLVDTTETLKFASYLSEEVDDYAQALDGRSLQFVAPDSPRPLRLYTQIADDRSGVGFATLEFLAIRAGQGSP